MRETNTLPVAAGKRIEVLDILRGFAVLGIFVVNIEIMNCIFMNQDAFAGQWTSGADRFAVRVLQLFFYSKFFPIFSFLFGLGIAMQALKRIEKGERGTGFFLRRMAGLFLIGSLHVVLLWGGDVVHMYALLGLLTMVLLRLPAPLILISSFVVLLFPYYEQAAEGLFRYLNFQPAAYLEGYSSEEAIRIIREGSYIEGIRFRVNEYIANIPLLYGFLAPVAFSMFLLGLYFGKKRYVHHIDQFVDKVKWPMIGLAVVTNVYRVLFLFVFRDTGVFDNQSLAPVLYKAMFLSDVAFGLFYLWFIAYAMRYSPVRKMLRPLKYAGRMALTNYLMQSLIGLIIFSSVGLSLYETLSPWQTLVTAVAVFAFQVIFSKVWLSYFRFGPLEWIWRAISYKSWPPFRAKNAGTAKANA